LFCFSAPVPARGSHHSELARQSAEFMKIARSIGRDISNTYAKLEKLTLLAKRKTIFDDRPEEIEELTHIIKEDMNALNRQIGQLQQVSRTTPKFFLRWCNWK
jgi:syntaxin 5